MNDPGVPTDPFSADDGLSPPSWDAGDTIAGNDVVWVSDLGVGACWALL